jgi:hypothetical protein
MKSAFKKKKKRHLDQVFWIIPAIQKVDIMVMGKKLTNPISTNNWAW